MSGERSILKPWKAATGAHPPDVKVGDDRGGFEISLDRTRRILRIRMWGLWATSVGEQFRNQVLRLGRGLMGGPWAIFADARDFYAQSAAVTEYRKEGMTKSLAMGCTKIAALVGHAVHGMQFKRIANESHVGSAVFSDEAAALAWVADYDDPVHQLRK
jgi:hypothetical protein